MTTRFSPRPGTNDPRPTTPDPIPSYALADALQGLPQSALKHLRQLGIVPPTDWPIFDGVNSPEEWEPGQDDPIPPAPGPAPEPTPEPTNEPTFEHTAPGSAGTFEHTKKNCSALNRAGQPCRSYRRLGGELCIFHDPDYAEELRANATRGGHASRPYTPQPDDFSNLHITLQDRTSLQSLIDTIVRLELFGKIPLNRSAHILRALSLAVRNFDKPTFVPGEGYRQLHDGQTYWGSRENLDDSIHEIVRALHDDHATARAQAISDAGARVYEVAKVKQLFAKPTT